MTETKRGGGGAGSEQTDSYLAAVLHDALEAVGDSRNTADAIAHTRRQIARALQARPNDVAILLRGADILVRVAATEHRISSGDHNDLAEKLRFALDDLEGRILPADR